MSLVLDSSVTLSWYFEDERTLASTNVLRQVAGAGAVAPALWRLEVANGFQMAIRRKRIDAIFRDASLFDLAAMRIAIDPDAETCAWSDILKLADRHSLTSYDAVYLELALRQELPLATLDNALRAAAGASGVTTIGSEADR